MSDQGEREARWTDMSESDPRDESWQGPGAEDATGPQASPGAGPDRGAKPPAGASGGPDGDDVKVAPVPEEDGAQWEVFDEGPGDDKYVPAVPVGADRPAKPGKPSSGNWQMPDWMADETAADAKLGGSAGPDEGGGRSRLVLFGGVGLLVVALVAAGAVFFLKGGGEAAEPDAVDNRAAAERSEAEQVELPPDKPLARFAGTPSRMLGRVNDAHSGLSYPRMAPPWQVPTRQNRLGTPGWSGQQIMVTERRGERLWYGQLLTGTLPTMLQDAYQGPESIKNLTGLAAQGHLAQYYAFPHKAAPLASQELSVDGRRGWLIASYLSYKRAGVQATGEVVATAVIDTGRRTPAVVFASMPNTHKKHWPDINQFFGRLKLAP